MTKKNVIVQNLNITYYQSDDFKQDGALIFLHGWQSQALHLKSVFENLDNYVAIDLPGFGLSDKTPAAWAATEYADFLKAFIQKLNITQPTLIGHSFGGSIIIRFLNRGGIAKKIILIDASGVRINTAKKTILKIFAKIAKQLAWIMPAGLFQKIRKSCYSSINSVDYVESGVLRESYLKIISEDLRADMARIKAPTTMIWGTEDQDVPLEYAHIMQKLISNSKLCEIPNAGHFPFIDQPEKFKEIFSKEINVN